MIRYGWEEELTIISISWLRLTSMSENPDLLSIGYYYSYFCNKKNPFTIFFERDGKQFTKTLYARNNLPSEPWNQVIWQNQRVDFFYLLKLVTYSLI